MINSDRGIGDPNAIAVLPSGEPLVSDDLAHNICRIAIVGSLGNFSPIEFHTQISDHVLGAFRADALTVDPRYDGAGTLRSEIGGRLTALIKQRRRAVA